MKIDGLEFTDNRRLVPTAPGAVALGVAISALETTLEGLGLSVARRHYRQAVDNFTDGNDEASNSQTRSYIEALLPGVSQLRTGNTATNPGSALQQLKQVGFLDDAEFNMIRAFWNGIQDNGPHAGLSTSQEAIFRFHTATAIGAHLLHKLNN